MKDVHTAKEVDTSKTMKVSCFPGMKSEHFRIQENQLLVLKQVSGMMRSAIRNSGY